MMTIEGKQWKSEMRGGQVQVYPVNDSRPHNVDTRDCWCLPEIEIAKNEYAECAMVTHNSADGREIRERAEKAAEQGRN